MGKLVPDVNNQQLCQGNEYCLDYKLTMVTDANELNIGLVKKTTTTQHWMKAVRHV